MSKVRLYGDTSGFVDLKAPDVANDVTITLPNTTGPFATETYVDSAIAAIPEIAGIGGNVVQAVKTDTFTTASGTATTITGLSVTITPSSASSKILLIANVVMGDVNTGSQAAHLVFTGGNSDTYRGDASGSRSRVWATRDVDGGWTVMVNQIGMYLDSPNTTSATTYNVAMFTTGGATGYINRSRYDADTARVGRGASSITAIEVAA